MFTDGRSKRVVFVVYCLLNQNSISYGTAVYPSAFKDIMKIFFDEDTGIVQLPCPELSCLGIDRENVYGADSPVVQENTRIRKEMQKTDTYKKLLALVDYVMQQILEYKKYGFEIVGTIGGYRCPNCGLETTSDCDRKIDGKGLFMKEISRRLEKNVYIC